MNTTTPMQAPEPAPTPAPAVLPLPAPAGAERALILFAHGARAASWAAPFERLRALAQARLPEVAVSLAFLELMEPRLPAQVAVLAAQGVRAVSVVPVFLGQGGHVLRDLPLIVDQLRVDYPHMTFSVSGAVGEDPQVLAAMTDFCVAAAGEQP